MAVRRKIPHATGSRISRVGAGMSRVIRSSSADVRSIFLEGWVASESAAGARLIVLEESDGFGKILARPVEPIILGDRQSANIRVDHFHSTTPANDEGYLDGVKHRSARSGDAGRDRGFSDHHRRGSSKVWLACAKHRR